MYKNNILLLVLLTFFGLKSYSYDFEVDGIYYNVLSGTDNEVEVTRGNYQLGYSNDSYQGDVIIPSNVVYSGIIYNVTVIGANSFRDSGDRVSSITIPNTIKSINKNAFMNCI